MQITEAPACHSPSNVDLPVQDIYIARAEEELALEEELYWGLVNIFRLPNVMFEMTKKTKRE